MSEETRKKRTFDRGQVGDVMDTEEHVHISLSCFVGGELCPLVSFSSPKGTWLEGLRTPGSHFYFQHN